MPGGTTIIIMSTSVSNEAILNVTFEELPEEWRNTIERVMQ
jgi:hypothetical protein